MTPQERENALEALWAEADRLGCFVVDETQPWEYDPKTRVLTVKGVEDALHEFLIEVGEPLEEAAYAR